jgi:hypothetical protein
MLQGRLAKGALLTTSELTYNVAGVVKNQGLPVAGITVVLVDLDAFSGGVFAGRSGERVVGRQRTGNRGDFSFAVIPGYYKVQVKPENGTRFLNYFSQPMTVRNNTTCNVSLTTGCVVSGRVLLPSGKPVEHGNVVAMADDQAPYKVLSKIVNGQYSLVVPRGTYHLAYAAYADWGEEEGGSTEQNGNQAAEFTSPPMVTNHYLVEVLRDVDFDLKLPALHEFIGTVFDSSAQPVKAARVLVSPSDSIDKPLHDQLGLMAQSNTNEAGKFQVLMQPGEYKLHIQPDETSSLLSCKEERVTVYENSERTFNLINGFRLRGQINYRDTLVKSCYLRVINSESGQEFQSRSDAKGQFALTLAAGSYRVLAKTDRPNANQSHAPTPNSLPADVVSPWTRTVIVGGDTHVSIKLQDGVPVSGKLVDEFGQPRTGVRISAFEESDDFAIHKNLRRCMASDITDDIGAFSLYLAMGSYKLVAHREFANAISVKVGKEPCTVDLTFRGWSHLKFEVTTDGGRGIARCRLRCYTYGRERDEISAFEVDREVFPRDSLVTDDDGYCQVTLPVGIYTLEFLPPKHSSYGERIIRQLSVNTDVSRKVTLPLETATAKVDS